MAAQKHPRTLLVIGGTGAMGSRVIRNFMDMDEAHEWRFRVLTRDATSAACKRLAQAAEGRVAFSTGSVSDPLSVEQAMEGVTAVFANTSYWSYFQNALAANSATGKDKAAWAYRAALTAEIRDGVGLLEAARRAGVQQFLHSSLDAMDRPSGGACFAPHFDAKAEVEAFIEEQRKTSAWYRDCVSVIVTAPYTENFLSSRMFRYGGETAAVFLDTSGPEPVLKLRVPIGTAAWPMASLDDIGWFSAMMLHRPEWAGKTLAMASDVLTMEEIATAFTRETGVKAVYEPYDAGQYEALGFLEAPAIAGMFSFFREHGVQRDLAQLYKLKPDLCNFRQWLAQTGWRGEPRTVQKDLAA